MKLSVVIASYGDDCWFDLALQRAYPSAQMEVDDVVMEHWEHGPIEAVRNVAVARSKGDWVCFLDADDELGRGFADAMRRAPGDDRRRLLAPAVEYVREHVSSAPEIPNTRHPMPPLNHCVVGTVVARQMFEDAGGFNENYWPWSDYELWLRCARRGGRVVEVPEAVYRVHVNPGSDNNTLTAREGQALGQRIHREHKACGGEWPIAGGEAHG